MRERKRRKSRFQHRDSSNLNDENIVGSGLGDRYNCFGHAKSGGYCQWYWTLLAKQSSGSVSHSGSSPLSSAVHSTAKHRVDKDAESGILEVLGKQRLVIQLMHGPD